MSRIDRAQYVEAMSLAATGVALVSTAGPAGRWGMTISAVASVSADPPTLLVCVNRRSPAAQAIIRNAVFRVDLLSEGQRDVADCFAGRGGGHAPFDFECAEWQETPHGVARLVGATASFGCTLDHAREVDSHLILIGRVTEAVPGAASPLVYCRRGYAAARSQLCSAPYSEDLR
jgi:flavin reductase (DIM6/NTAB) family NADH-FMN oxidoreductase RutF